MADNPPKVLYKYASPKAISYILASRKVSFTSLAELNDPFEAGSDLTSIVEEQLGLLRTYAKRAMETHSGRSVTDTDVDTYFNVLREGGITAETLRASASRMAWAVTLQKFRCFGILSLAERPDALLMWSHYGSCGNGIVVGLRADMSPITDSEFADMRGPQRVVYSEQRANFDAPTLTERLKQITLTKSLHWQYEQEWRCIRQIDNGSDRLLVDLPPDAVAEIIVGPRLSLEDIAKVVELHEKVYPQARLLMASPNPSRFQMDIIDLPPAKFLQVLADMTISVPPLNLGGRL